MIHDVVIAGAGPVGLFLACELRLAGVSVLVIEQADAADSPLKRLPFGIRGLNAPTLEALDRRGLLEEVAARQISKTGPGAKPAAGAHWLEQARSPAGHFAGIQFFHDRVDASKWFYRPRGELGTSMAIEMESLEAALASRAEAMGVVVRRGVAVDGVETSADQVIIHAGVETFHARWLVGCDGGRSAVRKLAGFEFAGTEPEFTGYSADIELADADQLRPGRHYTPTGMYTYAPPGTLAMVEFDGGACHRAQLITREHIQAVLRRVSGTDVTVSSLRLATTWTDRAFQATSYRKGRVLLAGDAAHIHSPLGGQGLNLGLGDAMNLGWKLAATIRGDAPDGLLDTYASERHPVGVDVLDWSRAQVAIMRPSPSSRALEAIIRDLVETRDGATYFAERVWGVSLRYALGEEHPLTGRSVPEVLLPGGRRVDELLRSGQGVLLDFGADTPLKGLLECNGGRVIYIACEPNERLNATAMLIRPDGIVAWATDSAAVADEVGQAILRWFG